MELHVPECGIAGEATVLAIGPCPAVDQPLPGYRTVTGTFLHRSAQVIDLSISGVSEPIGTTINHPFWSVDRETFVRADELTLGERVATLAGPAVLTAVTPRPGTHDVHNLEVQVDHVYHVAANGVLVHNARPTCGVLEFVHKLNLNP